MDVLVRPQAFRRFAQQLVEEGYSLHRDPWHVASHHFVGKAWLFDPPRDAMPVDLHRDLADRPWFTIAVDEWIDRATPYPSVDGPVLSLSPEDHVLYAAAHYANHRYTLNAQHLQDVILLLNDYKVDWTVILSRAKHSHLRLALALLVDALRARGAAAPSLEQDQGFVAAWRKAYAKRSISMGDNLRRTGNLNVTDMALLMPVLSDRKSALARYVMRSTVVRALDVSEVAIHALRNRRTHRNSAAS